MGQTISGNPGIVVEGAKIGCSYAQTSKEKENWEIKYLQIDHCDSEKVHGVETAHNHDCVSKENIPRFGNCVSPYYYEASGMLSSLYPQNKDYKEGYAIIREIRQGNKGRKYPPCILALLDTWFDYSDVEVSNKFQTFITDTEYFSRDMAEKLKGVYSWGVRVLYDKRRALETQYKANPSNATPVDQDGDFDMIEKLHDARETIDGLYKDGTAHIKRWQEDIDEIQIYEDGYADSLRNLSSEVDSYYKKWKPVFSAVGIKEEGKSYQEFAEYYRKIVQSTKVLGDGMENWEDGSYELLKTSFLVCKCGGIIELLSDGQERILYCNKLFVEFMILLKNAANYLQGVLDKNGIYPGVDEAENSESIISAKKSLMSIVNSFQQNKDFQLDDKTTSMQIRFITKGYNAEKAAKMKAMIGIMFLTPLSATASTGGSVAISVGTLSYDIASIMSQSKEDQKRNEEDDAETLWNDLLSYLNSTAGAALDVKPVTRMIGKKPFKMTQTAGKVLLAIGFINSLTGLFYTSDEDWIEEIEITVFTKYLAHIVKQGYQQDVTPKKAFDGISMVRAKTIGDYRCDALGSVKWDEMEGVSVAVDKDYGGASNVPKENVKNPNEMRDSVEKQTNGEVKK